MNPMGNPIAAARPYYQLFGELSRVEIDAWGGVHSTKVKVVLIVFEGRVEVPLLRKMPFG